MTSTRRNHIALTKPRHNVFSLARKLAGPDIESPSFSGHFIFTQHCIQKRREPKSKANTGYINVYTKLGIRKYIHLNGSTNKIYGTIKRGIQEMTYRLLFKFEEASAPLCKLLSTTGLYTRTRSGKWVSATGNT